MTRTIEAVYKDGVFKPLQPVDLAEGQHVQVTLPLPPAQLLTPQEAEAMMRKAHEVFAELSAEDWEEISQSWKRG